MMPPLRWRWVRMATKLVAATRLWRVLLLLLLIGITTLAIMPRAPTSIDFGWDKLNHVLAFAALAFSAGLGFPTPRTSRVVAPLALLTYGGLIELTQMLVPQRSTEWTDLLADGLGIACGALIASFALHAAARLSGTRR